jgi:hypothetical protein
MVYVLGSAFPVGVIMEWSGAMGNDLESITIIPHMLDASREALLYVATFKIHFDHDEKYPLDFAFMLCFRGREGLEIVITNWTFSTMILTIHRTWSRGGFSTTSHRLSPFYRSQLPTLGRSCERNVPLVDTTRQHIVLLVVLTRVWK